MCELVCASEVGVCGPVQATSGFRGVAKSPALRSPSFRTCVRDGGDSGMADDSAVVERGVLTAAAGAWDLAVRRAEVIGQLAGQRTVGLEGADAAAAELDVSRRQVYVLIRRWRARAGLASDLLPGGSSGRRGGGRMP